MQTNLANPVPEYVREKHILEALKISSPTLWRKVVSGEFPKPIKLSGRVTAWLLRDVELWLQQKGDKK
jgi:predicted DNA-binding transcriptional regulator AlpA